MPRRHHPLAMTAVAVLALAACGKSESQTTSAVGYGYNPALPAPNKTLLPTVKVSPVNRWANGATPTAAAGFQVKAFASGLDHPRWLLVLPNGDVLVAETNGPGEKKKGFSLKGWVEGLLMAKAGAKVPSANRISLLRDADGDGVAETKTAFLTGLYSPFGMALVGDTLYVANADSIVAFPTDRRDQHHRRAAQDRRPAGRADQSPLDQEHHRQPGRHQALCDGRLQQQCRRERHRGRGTPGRHAGDRPRHRRQPRLRLGPPQSQRHGLEPAERRAVDHRQRARRDRQRPGAGLYDLGEGRRLLWLALQLLRPARRQVRVKPQRPDLVAKAIVPDYALGAHTASLGLTFYNGEAFPERIQGRRVHRPARLVEPQAAAATRWCSCPFRTASPRARPRTVLTGFLNAKGEAQGRPVGVTVDKAGALLVADDVGNVVWRVTPAR
jgi:glucose/arabinose dehydrogenase